MYTRKEILSMYDELRIKLGQVSINISSLEYNIKVEEQKRNELLSKVQLLIKEEQKLDETEKD